MCTCIKLTVFPRDESYWLIRRVRVQYHPLYQWNSFEATTEHEEPRDVTLKTTHERLEPLSERLVRDGVTIGVTALITGQREWEKYIVHYGKLLWLTFCFQKKQVLCINFNGTSVHTGQMQ